MVVLDDKNSPACIKHRPDCFIYHITECRVMHDSLFGKAYSNFLS